MTGKALRMRRIGHEGLYVIIPLDHGVSVGPLAGIENPTAIIRQVDEGGATGVVIHKGLVKHFAAAQPSAGLLVHVSSSTDKASDPNDKRIVATPDEVLRTGADALSLHVNLGSTTEERQLEEFGRLTTACGALGLPVLCMMYPRGPAIKNPYEEKTVMHATRLAEELGADIVKTVYTGDAKSFRNVTSSVGIPVLVAGGPKMDSDQETLDLVHGAMRGGASGVSIGRNVFQHQNPKRMTEAIRRIVLDGAHPKDAAKLLKEGKA